MDGIFHVDEFEVTMDLDQGRSGAPDFSLDESVIGPRMDSPPWSLTYMQHQRDGAFWRAPLRPIEQLQVPALLIGGLQDGYRDSIVRMLERVKAPMKAWIGPWNHAFPNEATMAPSWSGATRRSAGSIIGSRVAITASARTRLVIYQQYWHPPGARPRTSPANGARRPGRRWPAPSTLYLQPEHRLSPASAAAGVDQLRYTPSAGIEAGFWWGELMTDQRPVDAFSLTYDSLPLDEDLAILGVPQRDPASRQRMPLSRIGSYGSPMSPPTARSRWSRAPASTAHSATGCARRRT